MKKLTLKRRQTTPAHPRAGGSRDPLQVQISIRAKLPKGIDASPSFYQDAIRYRVEHGHDHPAITTRIVQWRHFGGPWKTGRQETAWERLGNWLMVATVATVGTATVRRHSTDRRHP